MQNYPKFDYPPDEELMILRRDTSPRLSILEDIDEAPPPWDQISLYSCAISILYKDGTHSLFSCMSFAKSVDTVFSRAYNYVELHLKPELGIACIQIVVNINTHLQK